MSIKILFVVTSHDQIGDTGKQTGWYLPEVAHPYHVFKEAGYDVDFVSPKGGKAPMDEGSGTAFKDDKISQEFLINTEAMSKINKTMKPGDVNIGNYKVIMYAGGHGPMFDLPKDFSIAKLATAVYEAGGIVSAVCHGPVGLIPVKLSNGDSIVKGKTVTCFTNAEEEAVQLANVMPFPLETALRKLGCNFDGAPNFQPNVKESGRLITGQNPLSATPMAEAVVRQLQGK